MAASLALQTWSVLIQRPSATHLSHGTRSVVAFTKRSAPLGVPQKPQPSSAISCKNEVLVHLHSQYVMVQSCRHILSVGKSCPLC